MPRPLSASPALRASRLKSGRCAAGRPRGGRHRPEAQHRLSQPAPASRPTGGSWWMITCARTCRISMPPGDVAETADRLTGERYVHGNFPNAVAQGQVVAGNLLGWDVAYEGADSMNSLKHLGLPVMAVGQMEGEELRAEAGQDSAQAVPAGRPHRRVQPVRRRQRRRHLPDPDEQAGGCGRFQAPAAGAGLRHGVHLPTGPYPTSRHSFQAHSALSLKGLPSRSHQAQHPTLRPASRHPIPSVPRLYQWYDRHTGLDPQTATSCSPHSSWEPTPCTSGPPPWSTACCGSPTSLRTVEVQPPRSHTVTTLRAEPGDPRLNHVPLQDVAPGRDRRRH